ncbi:MAG: AAA family ATPase, partial [Candidatus Micrarchaeota archaeon]
MKFINRKDEMASLEEYSSHAKRQLVVLAISGLRRVGKTTLVREFIKDKKEIYFFVYESKTSNELLVEFQSELRTHGLLGELESVDSWGGFFDLLFKRAEGCVVVFDEFQNFTIVHPAVFSILQRHCDENKQAAFTLILLGSLIGLFKKIFEDRKEPLFGRISVNIKLEPFSLRHSLTAIQLLGYSDMEQMLSLYAIFGGFPKYYAIMEQFGLAQKAPQDVIQYLFANDNAPLESEVQNILSQEFGRRSPLYYSILHSIAAGTT